MRDREQAIKDIAPIIKTLAFHSSGTPSDVIADKIIHAYEALPDPVYEAARAALEAWDDFNNPKVRVGPVYPRMNDLRAALGKQDG